MALISKKGNPRKKYMCCFSKKKTEKQSPLFDKEGPEIISEKKTTLQESKSSHLKIDGWNTILTFCGMASFKVRTVCFWEELKFHEVSRYSGSDTIYLTKGL